MTAVFRLWSSVQIEKPKQPQLRRQDKICGRDLAAILALGHEAPQTQRVEWLCHVVQAGVADPALLVGLDGEAGVDRGSIGCDDRHRDFFASPEAKGVEEEDRSRLA